MDTKSTWDATFWYVIHTHPKQENRAEDNLRVLSIQTLAPKIREPHYNCYTATPTYLIKPLFHRYIFAKFKAIDLCHKVRLTRGVHSLVSFGNHPIPIDEQIIAIIRSRMGPDGLIRMNEDLAPGDAVIIKDGPFKNLIGIFERDLKSTDRVRVLLQTVSFQAHVVVEKETVRKLAEP